VAKSCDNIPPDKKKNYCHTPSVQLQVLKMVQGAPIEMNSEQSGSATYRSRAAVYSLCAQQDIRPEAATAFRYLEQMWLVVAEVADANLQNRLRSLVDGDVLPSSVE
jgi:hypothetical protein